MRNFEFKKLKLPVFQAPMAGGITTPELVSSVSNYGAVGSFGFAYSEPEKIRTAMKEVKKLTDGYINANFFVFKEVTLPKKEKQNACVQALTELPIEEKIELEIPHDPFFFSLQEQLDPIWENPPSILTFHFDIPPSSIIEKAKSLGIKIGTDIKKVIQNGAIAAQMGTAFLCCREAGTSQIYKEFLFNNHNRQTVFTRAFSGRPARGIENTFTRLMENKPYLPFPAQNTLTNKLRKIAENNKNGEFISLWAGKNYKKISNKTCLDILNQLKFEFCNPTRGASVKTKKL